VQVNSGDFKRLTLRVAPDYDANFSGSGCVISDIRGIGVGLLRPKRGGGQRHFPLFTIESKLTICPE
jgi:hypothetical protein